MKRVQVLLACCALYVVGGANAAERDPLATLSISLVAPDPVVLQQIAERVNVAGFHNEQVLADPIFILRIRKDGRADALFATTAGRKEEELQSPFEGEETRAVAFDRMSPLYELARQATREVNESEAVCEPPESLTPRQMRLQQQVSGCSMPQTVAVTELLKRLSAAARR